MEYGFLAAAAGSGGLLTGCNAIMGATGLGALGLFLMLPRDRATWAKLGGLIGVLALGWLFLTLAHEASHDVPIYFYIFATIMVGGAVGVICHPKPVYAALYFVLVTLAGAGLFVLLMAEFMAVVLIIVYAGAILVTYVFVIMLASQGKKVTPLYDRAASEPLMAVLVSFVLLGTVVKVMYRDEVTNAAPPPVSPFTDRDSLPQRKDPQMVASLMAMDDDAPVNIKKTAPGNMQLLGLSLYGDYALSLELAGVLLTIALVGAVVISRKNVDAEHEAGTGELPIE
jgi:NADH-quinone oxidoreductase subunit J